MSAPKVCPAKRDAEDQRVNKAFLVCRVQMDDKAPLVPQDRRDSPVPKASKVIRDHKDPTVGLSLASAVNAVNPAKRVARESPDFEAFRDLLERRVRRVWLVLLAVLAPLALKALRVNVVNPARFCTEKRVQRVYEVLRVLLALVDQRVSVVPTISSVLA